MKCHNHTIMTLILCILTKGQPGFDCRAICPGMSPPWVASASMQIQSAQCFTQMQIQNATEFNTANDIRFLSPAMGLLLSISRPSSSSVSSFRRLPHRHKLWQQFSLSVSLFYSIFSIFSILYSIFTLLYILLYFLQASSPLSLFPKPLIQGSAPSAAHGHPKLQPERAAPPSVQASPGALRVRFHHVRSAANTKLRK